MIRNTYQQVTACCAKSAAIAVICGMTGVFLLIPGAILTKHGYDTDSVFNKSSFFEDSQSEKRVAGPVMLAFSMALFLTSFIICVCGRSQSSNTSTGTGGEVVTTTTTTTDATQYPAYQSTAAYPPQDVPQDVPAYLPQGGATYPPQCGTTCPPLHGEATYLPQEGTTYPQKGGTTYPPKGRTTYQSEVTYPPQCGTTYPPQNLPAPPPVGQYCASYNEPLQFQSSASVTYQPQAAVMPTAPPIENTDLPPSYDELEGNNAVP